MQQKLKEFGRLLHFAVTSGVSPCGTDWVEVLSTHGLSARLTLRGMDQSILTECEKGWARLRSLEVVGFCTLLSSAAEHHPTVVFPHLRSLALFGLGGDGARDLLAALDRGAAPSRPSRRSHRHGGNGSIPGASRP